MIQTVEAVVGADGSVRLLQPLVLTGSRRALLTLIPDAESADEITRLSELALADWNRPEEDEAWSYLSPAK